MTRGKASAKSTALRVPKGDRTYYATAEGVRLTREQAIAVMSNRHGVPYDAAEELLARLRPRNGTYDAQAVLRLLGY